MKITDGMDRQPVQPRLERHLVRLVPAIAQGPGNYLVNHFVLRDGIGDHLFGRLTKIKLALDEPLQAREIRVHVTTYVLG